MKSSRLKNIENYIIENGTVKLDTLCQVFDVSKNTIRRDITELLQEGNIKKVYGGVIANNKSPIPFEKRNIENISEKKLIAKFASNLVCDGDTIFIDSGTTTYNMVEYLKEKKNITILSNNLDVIINALPYPNLNIISTGGSLVRKTKSFTGMETLSTLKNYNINKAFMASTGISISKGVTNSVPLEFEVKKYVVQKSDQIILLADSSKFNLSFLMSYCSLKDIDLLITSNEPPKEYMDYFKENSIELVISK